LKAYLALRGTTLGELRMIERRHNLARLVKEAVEKGLALSTQTQEDITVLGEAHSNFWHRYPRDDGSFGRVYLIDQFVSATRELLNAASDQIRGPGLGVRIWSLDFLQNLRGTPAPIQRDEFWGPGTPRWPSAEIAATN
jgi:hypothetical protein